MCTCSPLIIVINFIHQFYSMVLAKFIRVRVGARAALTASHSKNRNKNKPATIRKPKPKINLFGLLKKQTALINWISLLDDFINWPHSLPPANSFSNQTIDSITYVVYEEADLHRKSIWKIIVCVSFPLNLQITSINCPSDQHHWHFQRSEGLALRSFTLHYLLIASRTQSFLCTQQIRLKDNFKRILCVFVDAVHREKKAKILFNIDNDLSGYSATRINTFIIQTSSLCICEQSRYGLNLLAELLTMNDFGFLFRLRYLFAHW